MRFGYFDDDAREYVITTPVTPLPWINYLGCDDFFGLISNTGGGYCFYKDARLRRLLRYRYNAIPLDGNGRYFYVRDGDEIWSPGWQPVRTNLDRYECRHGLGYTRIAAARRGVRAECLFFVPRRTNAEVHQVTLMNESDEPRRLELFSFIEWCLWNAMDDMVDLDRTFSVGEVEVEGSVVYHTTEYRAWRDHFAFYGVNAPIDGFDTDRDSFIGRYNGLDAPAAVVEGRSRNSIACGWPPIASHHVSFRLEPGERRTFIFTLGYVENGPSTKWEPDGSINKLAAHAMLERFRRPDQVEAALTELRAYWDDLLSRFVLEHHDERLARMVNVWNQYQCLVTFNISRSASYFESGIGRGMGFRDSNQDILGFVHQIPERARERLLDLAATLMEDGSAYHQYQPLTKQGNHEIGSGFNDDPLWLILAVSAYLKETGDWSVLDEVIPYNGDPRTTGTMLEHLKRAWDHVASARGPHGLPLIGRADWNDCLNLNCLSTAPDEPFQTARLRTDGKVAESVLIAAMLLTIGPQYVEIQARVGNVDEVARARRLLDEMRANVDRHGWDGEWFLRAYDHRGHKVGSRENDEGRIFIETQGFGVMAGVGAADGRARLALDSVKTHLDTSHGIVLQQPPYRGYHVELGEISSYPPGYKENAGVFCHSNPWIMIAETILGRGAQAFEYYRKICPAYREDLSEVHRTEPYCYAQMIAGRDAGRHGEAKNSWLTGTASWNFVAISQYILGIRPDYDGLRVDPCIPPEWDGYVVRRVFRGEAFRIQVRNPRHVQKGVRRMVVDGTEVADGLLRPSGRPGVREVVVEMG